MKVLSGLIDMGHTIFTSIILKNYVILQMNTENLPTGSLKRKAFQTFSSEAISVICDLMSKKRGNYLPGSLIIIYLPFHCVCLIFDNDGTNEQIAMIQILL